MQFLEVAEQRDKLRLKGNPRRINGVKLVPHKVI